MCYPEFRVSCAVTAALLCTSLLLIGCSDDDGGDPACDGVICGTNAHCEDVTCVCDDGYVGDPQTACYEEGTCQPDSCNYHGNCDDSGADLICACDTGYAGALCETCDVDYDSVVDVCLNSQMVPCNDAAPANASSTVADVEITYTDAGGWTDPADCAWDCSAGYDLVVDECLSSQMVPCADVAPANATSTVVDVEITYTDAGGWTDPAECLWECDAGYTEQGGQCVEDTVTIHSLCDAICTEVANCSLGPYQDCYNGCTADLPDCTSTQLNQIDTCTTQHIPFPNCDPMPLAGCLQAIACIDQ